MKAVIINGSPGSDPCGDKMKKRIAKLSGKLYRDIRSEKSYPVQTLIHKVIFSFGIKPFVMKNEKDHTGTSQKWKELKIKI